MSATVSILTRYICRRILFYYFSLVAMIVVFFVFVDFMEHIDRIVKHHASLRLIGLYYACLTPRIFTEMSWLGFLVAMLFVLGGLARHNEFTAALAGGISIYRIALPVLFISALAGTGVFCVQEFVAPKTIPLAREIRETDFIKEPQAHPLFDIAQVGRSNRFYFFDVVDVERGELTGVHVHTKKGGRIIDRIDAEKAIWDESARRWRMENGVVKEFDSRGMLLKDTPFSSMEAPFKDPPKALGAQSADTAQLDFRQLKQKIRTMERSGYDAHRPKVEYHTRFALPVANLIVVFLGLPFALECRKGGLVIGFALSLMAALFYYGSFQIGLALGKGGFLPAAIAAWMANALFLGIGAGLTLRART